MDLRRLVLHRRLRKARKGETAQLAHQLAPLEERASSTAIKQEAIAPSGNGQPDSGAIIVDRDDSHVPRDMMEGGDKKGFLGMEPVVLIILVGMLTFIAFITWQISQMPAK